MKYIPIFIVCFLTLSSTNVSDSEDWGFYGHRLINELAVMTLPQDIIPFYKKNLTYISDHAVDPDKRRYASSFEAIRHYIDIDHWGEPPFNNLPRNWYSALAKTTKVSLVTPQDTITIFAHDLYAELTDSIEILVGCSGQEMLAKSVPFKKWKSYFIDQIVPQYYDDTWTSNSDDFYAYFGFDMCDEDYQLLWEDRISEYGVVPWHLQAMQKWLTKAFEKKDINRILRLSAELGHYIGDAHVPLHTTINYNGQLTDQVGIHGFWESRIPELFAEKEYDFFVGQAQYIENPEEYYWDAVLTSHIYVDSVLTVEKRMKAEWPSDQIYCFDERLNKIIKTECEEFARAYQAALDGLQEKRMRASIISIGSAWYTAWVDAGQPELLDINFQIDTLKENSIKSSLPMITTPSELDTKKFKIRKHE